MKLIAFNTSSGEVEIHKAGCADIKRMNKTRKGHWRSDQVEFGKTDWASKYAFAYDYWDNGILEEHEAEHGVGSFDVMAEMDFQPCTRALPDGGPEGCEYRTDNGMFCVGIANHDGDHVLRGTTPAVKPEPAPASRGKSYALRARARAALWAGIENQLNDSMYAEPELHEMMVQQAERVAFMFGMRDDK